jgi:hypothetical protein
MRKRRTWEDCRHICLGHVSTGNIHWTAEEGKVLFRRRQAMQAVLTHLRLLLLAADASFSRLFDLLLPTPKASFAMAGVSSGSSVLIGGSINYITSVAPLHVRVGVQHQSVLDFKMNLRRMLKAAEM